MKPLKPTMNQSNLVLGNILRKERRLARLSQRAVAHSVGMHQTSIGRIERGECSPTFPYLIRFAKAITQGDTNNIDIGTIRNLLTKWIDATIPIYSQESRNDDV